ncbi:hypothetical protein [Nostoc sp. 2RC]|uniref:hypothetical protein n=1 Tax=Nostoc sp. 2RC TaxID=2485484 RepID=UPI0037C7A2E2
MQNLTLACLIPIHQNLETCTGERLYPAGRQSLRPDACICIIYFDTTSAAYHVGYDDASHFNREYKRLFGAPAMRDVERLQEAVRETANSI